MYVSLGIIVLFSFLITTFSMNRISSEAESSVLCNYRMVKWEHWCKTIFHWVKEQPKISHFAKNICKKSVSMSTFKPPKVGKKIFLYSLLLLYLAGGNSLFLLYPAGGNSLLLLHPAGGNSSLLLHPAGGNSLVLLSLAGKQFDRTYFYREETNSNEIT